jgi:proteic killer suppression protein
MKRKVSDFLYQILPLLVKLISYNETLFHQLLKVLPFKTFIENNLHQYSSLNIKTFYLPLTLLTYNVMILNFGSKETEKIWVGERIPKLPLEIQDIGRRKLRMLNNSQNIQDLRIPPSNRLEKLSGKLKDLYSIRINDQWRIIFKWNNGNASEVEIIDYH